MKKKRTKQSKASPWPASHSLLAPEQNWRLSPELPLPTLQTRNICGESDQHLLSLCQSSNVFFPSRLELVLYFTKDCSHPILISLKIFPSHPRRGESMCDWGGSVYLMCLSKQCILKMSGWEFRIVK